MTDRFECHGRGHTNTSSNGRSNWPSKKGPNNCANGWTSSATGKFGTFADHYPQPTIPLF